METSSFKAGELGDSWVEGDDRARWRSATGHRGEGSGSSLLEVDPGNRLPRHTDSAEEMVVVVSGRARVTVGEESAELDPGGLALVPECVPHEVESIGIEPLRFCALYAAAEVETTYEQPVEPDGGTSRSPLG